MHSFEQVRSHISGLHSLNINDPYLISFELPVTGGARSQGIYLAELEAENGDKFLRISTPIGPLADTDTQRCLSFNWEQRTGFLAVSDLDGTPYLHLCENRPYALLDVAELDRVIGVLGPLADRLEHITSGAQDQH